MFTVIIPAYQETDCIGVTLQELCAFLPRTAQVVVAAADSSSAKGAACPTGRAALEVKDNRVVVCDGGGLAEGVRNGALAAVHRRVAVMDADGTHNPRDVFALLTDPADVAVGAHVLPKGLPLRRALLSKAAHLAVGARMPKRTLQAGRPTSGCFACSREALLAGCENMAHPQAFKVLVGVLMALPRGATVTNRPIQLRERSGGASKLGWQAIKADMLTLLRVAPSTRHKTRTVDQ